MKKQLLVLVLALLMGAGAFNARANIIVNGDFTNGSNGWTVWHATWEAWLTYNFGVVNNWAVFSNMNVGTVQHWYLQLNQILTPAQVAMLEVGQNYTLTFRAVAEGARPLKVFFGEDGGSFTDFLPVNTPGVGHLVTLGTTATTYTIDFSVPRTFNVMKLGFEGGMGNIGFSITDVTLARSFPTALNELENGSLQVYTTPGNELVALNLTPGSKVSIFSITGSLIESHVAGSSSIQIPLNHLDKGVYLVNANGQTRRVVVR